MTKKKEYVIWDCEAPYNGGFDDFMQEELENARENLEEGEELPDEYELLYRAHELNNLYLGDERDNLDVELDNEIIAIADLGLWNGRRSGYKIVGRNISDCLYSEGDAKWYVDNRGNFRCFVSHHDGFNEILYREFKDISDTQRENFIDKVYEGTVTPADISRYTRRIGDRIANVYGWRIK